MRIWIPPTVAFAASFGGCGAPDAPPPPKGDTAEDTAPTCGDGERWDGGACVPERCGDAPWGPAADADWFVDPTVAPGGAGSAEDPFATLDEALAAARGGGARRIALAAGEHLGRLGLDDGDDGLVVRGRCRELVGLSPPEGAGDALLALDAAATTRVELAELRLHDHVRAVTNLGGTVVLSAVDVEDVVGPALDATGGDARFELADVALRRVGAGRGDDVGYGLRLDRGAGATLAGLDVEAATTTGVDVEQDATLDGAGLRVLGTEAPTGFATALWVGDGARVELEGFESEGGAYGARVAGGTLLVSDGHLDGHTLAALLVLGGEATLTAVDVAGPGEPSSAAYGADVVGGASLSWTGGEIVGTGHAGVYASEDAVVVLRELVLHDAVGDGRTGGVGVLTSAGVQLELGGVTVRDVQGAGLFMEGGSHALVEDLVVEGVRAWDTGAGGIGVELDEGVELDWRGGSVSGTDAVGVYLVGAAARLEEVTLTGSGSGEDDGLRAGAGSVLELALVSVADFGGVGVYVAEGGTVGAEGSTVTGCGLGIASFAGVASWTGGTLAGNVGLGAGVQGEGGELRLVDSRIEDTEIDPDHLWGHGVSASFGASLYLTRTVVSGSTGRGIVLDDSYAELVDVEVLDTRPLEGEANYGVGIRNGSTVLVEGLGISGAVGTGLHVYAAGTEDAPVEVSGLRVEGTTLGDDWAAAFGVLAFEGAWLVLDGAEVSGTEGPALYTQDAGLRCVGCRLEDSAGAGVAAVDGALELLDGTTVSGVAPLSDSQGGLGVWVGAPHEGESASMWLRGVTVEGADGAAVYLGGPGSWRVEASRLLASTGDEGAWPSGQALVLVGAPDPWDGELGLDVEDTELSGSGTAAVLLHGATGRFVGNTWGPNTLDLVQQSCGEGLAPPEGLDGEGTGAVELCPAYDHHFVPVDLDYNPLP